MLVKSTAIWLKPLYAYFLGIINLEPRNFCSRSNNLPYISQWQHNISQVEGALEVVSEIHYEVMEEAFQESLEDP